MIRRHNTGLPPFGLTFFKKYQGGHEDVFKAINSIETDHLQSRQEAENKLNLILKNESTSQFLMKNLTRSKNGGYEWKMNLKLLEKKYQNILSEVSFDNPIFTKTLFIKGDRSDYILEEDFPSIKKVIPEATLITITNAGHWVHADQPDELFNKIIDFIEE